MSVGVIRDLTGGIFGVFSVPVVGAAALVQTRIRGGAAITQRAAPATNPRISRVQMFRTLKAVVIVPNTVQPAVAVLGPSMGQVPCQIKQNETVHPVRHGTRIDHFYTDLKFILNVKHTAAQRKRCNPVLIYSSFLRIKSGCPVSTCPVDQLHRVSKDPVQSSTKK